MARQDNTGVAPRPMHPHPARSESPKYGIASLYDHALPAKRTGPIYTAFPYPTKIDPEAIALFIASHTQPGATVFDGFAGSGMTGIAALLCADPPASLRSEAARRGLPVTWGPRNAVLYELSSLGAFVASMLNNPPDPTRFRKVADELLQTVETACGWMYSARDPHGKVGSIRHVIWSDVVRCSTCGHEATLWDACVSLDPAKIDSRFHCPACNAEQQAGNLDRATEVLRDDLLGACVSRRKRSVARIYGATGTTMWERPVNDSDSVLLARIDREPIPDCVPKTMIPWGDLYRRGYHHGISHVHHFYTRRNLIAFARLWDQANRVDASLRDAVRFWLLSYHASHATTMTRAVAKSGQKGLVVTSAQPGVLYVSGLPVEKNILRGLRRKLTTIAAAFKSIHGRAGRVAVHRRSSCTVDLPDRSVDYVFTDPPFGGNIPYSETSFLNEAWLGELTDTTEEAIINRTQGKTLDTYQALLTAALSEVRRILKPGASASLVFHSTTAGIWNALRNAYSEAGLSVEHAGVLDKKQRSFKQVTASGAVRGDPVLLLRKQVARGDAAPSKPWEVAAQLSRDALTLDASERTRERLYSRFVSHFLANNQEVPVDAADFYRWHAAQQVVEADDAS